ncbi:MAG TPA: hypothetical protein VGR29_03255 [Thermomicrobiales bacterium]|nr:hypothetical protein [Thermomicrobiales bacterium]
MRTLADDLDGRYESAMRWNEPRPVGGPEPKPIWAKTPWIAVASADSGLVRPTGPLLTSRSTTTAENQLGTRYCQPVREAGTALFPDGAPLPERMAVHWLVDRLALARN